MTWGQYPACNRCRSQLMRPVDAILVAACVGDCNGDGAVAIKELIIGVNIALCEQPVGTCPASANPDGMVDIAQLVTAVNNALDGCGNGGRTRIGRNERREEGGQRDTSRCKRVFSPFHS